MCMVVPWFDKSIEKKDVPISIITLVILCGIIRTKWEFLSIFGQAKDQDTVRIEKRSL